MTTGGFPTGPYTSLPGFVFCKRRRLPRSFRCTLGAGNSLDFIGEAFFELQKRKWDKQKQKSL